MQQKALHATLKSFGMDELDLEISNKMSPLLDRENRSLPQVDKTRILNEVFDSISEEAFAKRIDIMITQVNMSEDECRKYSSATKQMESVVARLPRLAKYKVPLLKRIKDEREGYGL
jgi:hypothetical protein